MTVGRRRFTTGAPGWGESHLGLDAVVAFVDDELSRPAHQRASEHVAACPECAAEVVAQRQARTELRGAEAPSLPSSLLSSLRAIPDDTDLPGPPPGLALTADGQFVALLRPERQPPPDTGRARSARRSPMSRRVRLGAGAAVSGIALGALALGAPAAPDLVSPADAGPGGFVGVPAGSAAAVLDARMTLGPVATTTEPSRPLTPTVIEHGLAERLDRLPVVSPFRVSR